MKHKLDDYTGKEIRFTAHGAERVHERLGINLDGARRLIWGSSKVYETEKEVHYKSKIYVFVCNEDEKQITVITAFKQYAN